MRRVMRTGSLGLIVTAISLGVSPGLAQNVEQVKPVFEHIIPNAEGKRMVAVVVTYPPGAKSPAHRHARLAFIFAYVLSGAIRSQVGDEPAKVLASQLMRGRTPKCALLAAHANRSCSQYGSASTAFASPIVMATLLHNPKAGEGNRIVAGLRPVTCQFGFARLCASRRKSRKLGFDSTSTKGTVF